MRTSPLSRAIDLVIVCSLIAVCAQGQYVRPLTREEATLARMTKHAPGLHKNLARVQHSRNELLQRTPSLRSVQGGTVPVKTTVPSYNILSSAGEGHSFSDSVAAEWVRHYASGLAPSTDQAIAAAIDNEGNVYVTGSSTGPFTGVDYATVKYDAAGTQQWVVRYNSPENLDETPVDICVDGSGNVYVTGTNQRGIFTIKYNTAGLQQWIAQYPESSSATALAVDSSGNIYVAGTVWRWRGSQYVTIKYNAFGLQEWAVYEMGGYATALAVDAKGNIYVSGTSADEYATVKYNAAGVQQWVARYGGGSYDIAYALAVDFSGVYVTGESFGPKGGSDYVTVKYSGSGGQEWVASYIGVGTFSFDTPVDLCVDKDGNVYVTGSSWSSDSTSECATVKYNSAGVEQWAVRHTFNSSASGLGVDTSGNVYITGASGRVEMLWGPYFEPDSMVTIKYDSVGVEQWVVYHRPPQTFGGGASSLIIDGAGDLYVTGYLRTAGTGRDYAVLKYNSSGMEQWSKQYSGPGNNWEVATSLFVDGPGNIYVTGSSVGSGGFADYATVKYDAAGVLQWVTRYDGPMNEHDAPSAIAGDAWGNVYVTGQSRTTDSTLGYATVKYNSTGTQQWVTYYGVGDNSNPSALVVDANGSVFVTGTSQVNGSTAYATVKYNTDGGQQWLARYDGGQALALAVDLVGNVYVTGQSDNDITTIKYDLTGAEKWSMRYDGPSSGNMYDVGTALAVDSSGNVYVAGYSYGVNSDLVVIKYDSSGIQKWVTRYNGPWSSGDGAHDIAPDGFGGVYVTGWSEGARDRPLSEGEDFVTIRYDSAGTLLWVARYNSPEGDYAFDSANNLVVDSSGKVYVTGVSGAGFATLAYDPDGYQLWAARYKGPAGSYGGAIGVDLDDAGNVYVAGSSAASNWSLFSIVKYNQAPSSPAITLLSPNGYESWRQGTTHEIRWSKKGPVDTVQIEYTTNNGSSWTLIAVGVPASKGSFVWNLPNIHAAQVRVRISWKDSTHVNDQSDSQFSITPFSAGPWIQSRTGMGPIWSIVIDPSEQRTMYAGSITTGMWKSTDGGFTWKPINNGLFNQTIQACGISTSNPQILYCGTSSQGDSCGVYKSTNAGFSWSRINTGITEPVLSVQAIAVDPMNPEVAYVAVMDLVWGAIEGIYKTTNGGASWFVSNSGIGPVKNFLSFAINPHNPQTIYAGSSFKLGVIDTNQARVYKSYDGGNTWSDASNGLPRTQGKTTHNPIRTLSIDGSDTSQVLAGVFRNDTSGGAFLTTNGGVTWEKIHNGLPRNVGTLPRSVLIRSGSTTEYYMGFGSVADTGFGVYRTTNAGQSWEEFNGGSLSNAITVRALAFRTFGGDALFAGGANPYVLEHQGVFAYQLTPTAVEKQPGLSLPTQFVLSQNYPNPFNLGTVISYHLPFTVHCSLRIYDLLGRVVATLVDEEQPAGVYRAEWNAAASSGVYFYRLEAVGKDGASTSSARSFVETKKLLLLK